MRQLPNLYELYEDAVTDPGPDIRLFKSIFHGRYRREPERYREDFCGTFVHAAEWVCSSKNGRAWCLDLSKQPLLYGEKKHRSTLSPEQIQRLKICHQSVLAPFSARVDLVTAMNFSYFCFKSRDKMKNYFSKVFQSLRREGLFLIDVIGGSQMHEPNRERRKIQSSRSSELRGRPFYYVWEQYSFDPISHDAQFAMHFEIPSWGQRIQKAFTYDWRLWTIPELREILSEVGFKTTTIYWEGTTRQGTGNGIFTPKTHEENCEVWIAYIAAFKS